MTARALVSAIKDDLTDLFKERRFNDSDGNPAALNIFEFDTPRRQSDDDPDPVPYIIVRVSGGGVEDQTDPHKVSVLLLVGIFDVDIHHAGARTVVEILELIQKHYEEKQVLMEQFSFNDPVTWVTQDEPSYPYYFGAANTTWSLPAPRKEWSKMT